MKRRRNHDERDGDHPDAGDACHEQPAGLCNHHSHGQSDDDHTETASAGDLNAAYVISTDRSFFVMSAVVETLRRQLADVLTLSSRFSR